MCQGWKKTSDLYLGGGSEYFLFSPLPGEMIQFDKYFSNGLVQPPTRYRDSKSRPCSSSTPLRPNSWIRLGTIHYSHTTPIFESLKKWEKYGCPAEHKEVPCPWEFLESPLDILVQLLSPNLHWGVLNHRREKRATGSCVHSQFYTMITPQKMNECHCSKRK